MSCASPEGNHGPAGGVEGAGTCPSMQVGCRVPYCHTLIAKAPGVTVMTWNYRDFGGPQHGPAPKDRHCPAVTHVRFQITVTG